MPPGELILEPSPTLEAYGSVWRIPKHYTREVLASRLQQLPHEFEVQWPAAAQEVSRRLEEAGCCVFELQGRSATDEVPEADDLVM